MVQSPAVEAVLLATARAAAARDGSCDVPAPHTALFSRKASLLDEHGELSLVRLL